MNYFLQSFYADRRPTTLLAYQADLHDFCSFVGVDDTKSAARQLLSGGAAEANLLALKYRERMKERQLAPATINRRLAALRSLVKLANVTGVVPWQLHIKNQEAAAYRDTRGPGEENFNRLIEVAQVRTDPKGARDVAIIALLHDLALRRAEVVRLDIEDVDLNGMPAACLQVMGKGRDVKQRLTLPEATAAAIANWIKTRGTDPGPLFHNFHRDSRRRTRLTGTSVYRIVRQIGTRIGAHIRPHGLRHTAITEALELMKGDVRSVQRFSRHKDIRVLGIYDDNRTDVAGELARMISTRRPKVA